jgi:hypothetical protein
MIENLKLSKIYKGMKLAMSVKDRYVILVDQIDLE